MLIEIAKQCISCTNSAFAFVGKIILEGSASGQMWRGSVERSVYSCARGHMHIIS